MTLTVTHTTPADGSFSATGAAAWDANHALTVSGTSGQVQFNNAGDLAGDAGLTFDATAKALTVGGGTVTASFPVLSASQTWQNAAVTFTALKVDVTDDASNASSLLMDLRVGGTTKFNVSKTGMATVRAGSYNNPGLQFGNASNNGIYYGNGFEFLIGGGVTTVLNSAGFLTPGGIYGFCQGGSGTADLILSRKGAANLRLGAADAASPVAQTLSVQSVVAGPTTNTPGVDFKITGSQGIGSGAGGSIIFQVAPAGTAGNTAQNTLVNAFEILPTLDPSLGGPALRIGPTGPFLLPNYGGSGRLVYFRNVSTPDFAIGEGGNGGTAVRYLGFSTSPGGVGSDLILTRDAESILAQRNGATKPQTFRLYNTYSDGSNYERAVFDWTTTPGTLTIGTQNAGTGSARNVQFVVGGTTALTIDSTRKVTGYANSNLFSLNAVNINGSFYANEVVGIGGNILINTLSGQTGLALASILPLSWSPNNTVTNYSDLNTPDLKLYRDAANTLAQRNGVFAQTSRLYGTYSDTSNYRRLAMTMSAGGVAEIKPEGAGTGVSGNVLHISGLPTSNPGPGILWNNAGTPAIGT